MESVMENGTCGASQKKTVTESVTEYMIYSVMEKRHGKRHPWSVTKNRHPISVTEMRHGKRHGMCDAMIVKSLV